MNTKLVMGAYLNSLLDLAVVFDKMAEDEKFIRHHASSPDEYAGFSMGMHAAASLLRKSITAYKEAGE